MTGQKQVSNKELKEDLKRVDELIEGNTTMRDYREHGEYSDFLIQDRLGSWNKAKKELGLTYQQRGESGRISDQELLDSIKELAEQKQDEEPLKGIDYREHGEYSLVTVRKRFGSWTEAAEKADVNHLELGEHPVRESMIEAVENKLEDKRGRMLLKDFKKLPEEEAGVRLTKIQLPDAIERINERDNSLTVTQSSSGGNATRVFVENEEVGLYDDYYDKLPSGTERVFEAVMEDGRGFSPKSVLAGIKYIYGREDGVTQADIAGELDITDATIRNAYKYIEEKGFDEEIKEARE